MGHFLINEIKYCIKNEKECIIRFKNSKRSRVNFLYRSTHSCTFKMFRFGDILDVKTEYIRKLSNLNFQWTKTLH